jgi:hypothetical protein
VSDDLIAFVLARLDEDEAIARKLAGWPHWHHTPAVTAHGPVILIAAGEDDEIDVASVERELPEVATHIARYDPARALREVAAKRARIERHKRAITAGGTSPSSFVCGQDDGYAEACLDSIRDDAAVWSDHPDYRAEWAP